MFSFGVTFMLDPPPSRVVELAQLAEELQRQPHRQAHHVVPAALLEAFDDKGSMRSLMETIPVVVCRNERLGLLGAARRASRHAAIC